MFEGVWSVWRALRVRHFDIACLAGAPDITSLTLTFLADIPCIVAPRVEGGEVPLADVWYRTVSHFVLTRPHTIGSYAPREYLRLLEPLGIHAQDTKKHIVFSKGAEARVGALLPKGDESLIGISPGAGNKIKAWPPERFSEVANVLACEKNAKLVLFGGVRDRMEIAAMRTHLSKAIQICDLSEKLSIDELKAAISKLDLFIAVDTGPIYIAEAFGVATVDIIGPMDEREQPPVGERHEVVIPPPPRIPQLHIMNAHPRDKREARRQIESITSEAVIRACRRLLLKS